MDDLEKLIQEVLDEDEKTTGWDEAEYIPQLRSSGFIPKPFKKQPIRPTAKLILHRIRKFQVSESDLRKLFSGKALNTREKELILATYRGFLSLRKEGRI